LFTEPANVTAEKADLEEIRVKLKTPNSERIFYIGDAFRAGLDTDEISRITGIDPWFLHNIKEIVAMEKDIAFKNNLDKDTLRLAKEYGFSDRQLAKLVNKSEEDIGSLRKSFGLKPDFKLVDTCAAEFRAFTPYYYSTYDK
jgi:carbamoyl-phosphate synthase large subunit